MPLGAARGLRGVAASLVQQGLGCGRCSWSGTTIAPSGRTWGGAFPARTGYRDRREGKARRHAPCLFPCPRLLRGRKSRSLQARLLGLAENATFGSSACLSVPRRRGRGGPSAGTRLAGSWEPAGGAGFGRGSARESKDVRVGSPLLEVSEIEGFRCCAVQGALLESALPLGQKTQSPLRLIADGDDSCSATPCVVVCVDCRGMPVFHFPGRERSLLTGVLGRADIFHRLPELGTCVHERAAPSRPDELAPNFAPTWRRARDECARPWCDQGR